MIELTSPSNKKVFSIQGPVTVPKTEDEPVVSEACPHVQMLEVIRGLTDGRTKPQKNLSQVIIHPTNRRTRVAMVMTPFWSIDIAPYNIARLTALAKASGFAACAYDLNVLTWDALPNKHTHESLWHHYNDWKWEQHYLTLVHPQIEAILLKHIDRIVAFAPDVIGFSLYYCNNDCAAWCVERLKERLPNAKFLAGGSQAIQEKVKFQHLFDHIVQGEGEQLFLKILESIEAGETIADKILIHPKGDRIDLDSMPWPDYSDLDLDLYRMGTSVGAEISRGCVAKCQFCSETTFWRYRGRLATNIVDEIEYQYKTFGARAIWFIDSLVNGNLKELRSFALGVVEKGLTELRWVGYCRCDERMDLAYLQDLKNSGCEMLNFGIESGSQHVLDLMKKNVKRESVEQNLRDLSIVGINAFTNWFAGFPGETHQDFYDTMSLMWRTRKTRIIGYAVQVCFVLPDTPLGLEKDKFNISHGHWGCRWTTNDYKNTGLHRLMRLKSMNIVMSHMRQHVGDIFGRGPNDPNIKRLERPGVESHYELAYDHLNQSDDVPYENFDHNIIKININPVADTLVNEIWPLLRILWHAMGQYEITVRFNNEDDLKEFGPNIGFPKYEFHSNGDPTHGKLDTIYNFNIWFKIHPNGDWQANFKYDLQAGGPNCDPTIDGFDYGFRLNWQGKGQWGQRGSHTGLNPQT